MANPLDVAYPCNPAGTRANTSILFVELVGVIVAENPVFTKVCDVVEKDPVLVQFTTCNTVPAGNAAVGITLPLDCVVITVPLLAGSVIVCVVASVGWSVVEPLVAPFKVKGMLPP